MTLDYSALTQPVTKNDIATFKATATEQQNKIADSKELVIVKYIGLAFTVIVVVCAFLFGPQSLIALIIPIPAAIVYRFRTIAARRKQTERRARLYKFATANSIRFLYDATDPHYSGSIFDEGDGHHINDALIFNDGIEIGNYEYSTWSGKNRLTHTWGYVRVRLTRRLPNMILDARSNNIFANLTNLPDSFARGQSLSLEGDFDKHFTLYAPKQYERDALYVFTPDVMAALIDNGHAYDMEVIDDSLILYSTDPFTLESETQLKTLLSIVEKVGSEIRDQSHYYSDDRTANRVANIVTEPARRLNIK
jgi:hypothetical protein